MIVISKLTPHLEICMSPVDYYYDGPKFIILHDKENYFDGLVNIENGECFCGNVKNNRHLEEALRIFCEDFRKDLLYNWELCRNEINEYKLGQLLRKI